MEAVEDLIRTPDLAMEVLEAVLVELLQQVIRVLLLRQAMED